MKFFLTFANTDFMNTLYTNYGEFYDNNCNFWWTAESQFLLSILNSSLYYFDYLQNNNYYNGQEMWVNDYHGIEKYDKSFMKTIYTFGDLKCRFLKIK